LTFSSRDKSSDRVCVEARFGVERMYSERRSLLGSISGTGCSATSGCCAGVVSVGGTGTSTCGCCAAVVTVSVASGLAIVVAVGSAAVSCCWLGWVSGPELALTSGVRCDAVVASISSALGMIVALSAVAL